MKVETQYLGKNEEKGAEEKRQKLKKTMENRGAPFFPKQPYFGGREENIQRGEERMKV